jgi:hypothetical protein
MVSIEGNLNPNQAHSNESFTLRFAAKFFLQRPNFLVELAEESWLDLAAVIRMRTFLP